MTNNTNALLLFKVGDGVHFTGWTDTNAGTVVEVKPHRITIARCELVLDESARARLRAAGTPGHRFNDGDLGVTFKDTTNLCVFTKRKDGTFREQGCKTILHTGRSHYRDPSF